MNNEQIISNALDIIPKELAQSVLDEYKGHPELTCVSCMQVAIYRALLKHPVRMEQTEDKPCCCAHASAFPRNILDKCCAYCRTPAKPTNTPTLSIPDVGLVDAWVDGWLECLHEHDIDHGFTDEVEHKLAAERARKNLGITKS